MDATSLVAALTAAVEVAPLEGEADLSLSFLLHQVEDDPANADRRLSTLLEQLRSEPELEIFDGKMQCVANAAWRVELKSLASWLIRRAAATGEEQAVSDLQRYLGSTEIPFVAILVVAGIKIEKSCDFGHGIELLPWERLPESRQKNVVFQQFAHGPMFHLPSAAIMRPEMLPRLHFPPGEGDPHQFKQLEHRELKDALLCTGLVGPTSPYIVASWLAPPEWAPVFISGYSMPHPDGLPRNREWPIGGCDQARALYDTFSHLGASRKARLRLPMERVNSAMRRISLVDAAVDLGIALESLFLRDVQEDRGELTFRLRVRAARFLGRDPSERRRLSAILRDLYVVRSIAVHTGVVPEDIRGTPVRQLLENGYELVSQSIIRFISEGEPDWDFITFS